MRNYEEIVENTKAYEKLYKQAEKEIFSNISFDKKKISQIKNLYREETWEMCFGGILLGIGVFLFIDFGTGFGISGLFFSITFLLIGAFEFFVPNNKDNELGSRFWKNKLKIDKESLKKIQIGSYKEK